ncbi:MAG: hypothetical protein M3362_13955, partial [Acidobacteriota bacterium]|nr:hypothetical protein [Acidobacteriota bacterium]
MMRKLFALLLILTLDGLLLAHAQTSSPSRPLVFTHVTIIDVTGGPSKSGMTVVVVGKRIVTVGRNGKVRIPPDAQIIDASGKFLIPGLWDMHVHTLAKEENDPSDDFFLTSYIAYGVTGVRDMGSGKSLEQIDQLRKEIEEEKRLGPRIFAAGPIVNGPDPIVPSPDSKWVIVT